MVDALPVSIYGWSQYICGEIMKFKSFFAALLLGGGLFLSGCAEQAQRVPATYIPSIVYRGATCQELYDERVMLAGYVKDVTQEQRMSAQSDTVFFSYSLIFWPAIFALPISVDMSSQLATARGHYDALSKAMAEQGCMRGARGSAPQAHAPEIRRGAPTGAAHPVVLPNWKRYPGQFPPL